MVGLTAKQRLVVLILLVTMTIGGILFYVETTNGYSVELRTEKIEKLLKIHVCGAVKNPGIVEIAIGSRVADALDSAGGATIEADLNRLNLAEYLLDGEQIYVPKQGEVRKSPSFDSNSGKAATKSKKTSKSEKLPSAQPGANIDLNLATVEQLESVPGIGAAMSRRILDYREANNGFKSYEELGNVKGIGDGYLEKFRSYLTVR